MLRNEQSSSIIIAHIYIYTYIYIYQISQFRNQSCRTQKVRQDTFHLGTTYTRVFQDTYLTKSNPSLITYGYEPYHQSQRIYRYKQSSLNLLPCFNLTVKNFNNIYRTRINVVFSGKWLDFQGQIFSHKKSLKLN